MSEPADPHSDTVVASLETAAGARLTSAQDAAEVLANRYELLGMLGAGAMGTVYRARDKELDEIVALKVLKKELAAAPGMLDRFRREVKLARRVTHKNVARTFDIGEHGGDRFLTMEFVDGEMLGAKLAHANRLSVGEAFSIARDVCDGLAAAHGSGVLHRDLKPENVVVAKAGHAVITDFGIARALEGESGKTAAGGFVGTPAYMAPEQVEGAADLDGRADLYALGAMLFELLTGRTPWPGDSVIAVAAARLLRPPPDPRTLVPDLPEPVALLVMKLMARIRDDRPRTAEDVKKALDALASVEKSASIPPPPSSRALARAPDVATRTLAVLPLLNLGAEDDAYLAQTVTEDLVDALSVVPELRVRPRGETASHDKPHRDVREVGRTLGVEVVVDGSLRRADDQVRVAVRLVTVADGFQLWAKRFDRPAAEILTVADAATAAIARALTTRDVPTARSAVVVDPVAQDLYMRARYLLHRAWYEVADGAAKLLREAYARAPGDARIAGTLGVALARIYGMGLGGAELHREARSVTDQALRIDASQPEAHVARGMLHLFHAEGAAAANELRIALELAPNHIDALDSMGRLLLEVDCMDEGIALLTRVLAIEPDYFLPRGGMARAFALNGDWERATEMLGPLPKHPGDIPAYLLTTCRQLLWHGDKARAEAVLEQVRTGIVLTPYARGAIEGLLRITRERTLSPADDAEIQQSLGIGEGYSPRRRSFNCQTRAEVFLACGLEDRAIEMLEVADSNGLVDLVWLDKCPLIAPLRGRPELARIRAATAQRAARVRDALER